MIGEKREEIIIFRVLHFFLLKAADELIDQFNTCRTLRYRTRKFSSSPGSDQLVVHRVDIMAGLSVVGLDPLTPTYFEMVLCDSLTRTARPAFLHLLSTFARRTSNVGNIGMYMLGYSEEVVFDSKVYDRWVLHHFEEATWFEDFYGLKRCSERPPHGLLNIYRITFTWT